MVLLQTEVREDTTVRRVLMEVFGEATDAQIFSQDFISAAKLLNNEAPTLLHIWISVYTLFAGFSGGGTMPYALEAVRTKQKLATALSFATCVALDNYYSALVGSGIEHRLQFKSNSGMAQ